MELWKRSETCMIFLFIDVVTPFKNKTKQKIINWTVHYSWVSSKHIKFILKFWHYVHCDSYFNFWILHAFTLKFVLMETGSRGNKWWKWGVFRYPVMPQRCLLDTAGVLQKSWCHHGKLCQNIYKQIFLLLQIFWHVLPNANARIISSE